MGLVSRAPGQASDWSILVTWLEYWPLIGRYLVRLVLEMLRVVRWERPEVRGHRSRLPRLLVPMVRVSSPVKPGMMMYYLMSGSGRGECRCGDFKCHLIPIQSQESWYKLKLDAWSLLK